MIILFKKSSFLPLNRAYGGALLEVVLTVSRNYYREGIQVGYP